MRIVFALLLAVHGIIHLLGFLQRWKLVAVPQSSERALVPLSETGAQAVGVFWLLMTADRYYGATGGLERWGGRSSE